MVKPIVQYAVICPLDSTIQLSKQLWSDRYLMCTGQSAVDCKPFVHFIVIFSHWNCKYDCTAPLNDGARWKQSDLGRAVAYCVFRAEENSRFLPFRSNITQRIWSLHSNSARAVTHQFDRKQHWLCHVRSESHFPSFSSRFFIWICILSSLLTQMQVFLNMGFKMTLEFLLLIQTKHKPDWKRII